ncbi:hypothetical protein EJB05_41027, partial [Eragrostis curvula]
MSKLQAAGWADLPCDLLESVLGRLPVPDRLRFPAVCTAWQSAAAPDDTAARLQNPTVPSPWLMLPFNPTSHKRTRSSDGNANLRYCCFTDDGDEATVMMIPPETFAADRLRYELYEKAILVSPPRWSGSWGGYAVLLICQPLFRLAIARAGDAEWTLLDTPARCWVDAACRRYIVELSPGRLLQVHRLRDAAHARYKWEPSPEHVEYTTAKVELFEYTTAGEGGRGQWAPLDSGKSNNGVLAGRALFLGKSASLCVPVDDGGCCPGVKGNCVYFTDDGPWTHERCHEVAPDVGVLDLADGSYRPPRGAVRDLLWKWPPPVWVFPSLAN